MTTHEQQVFVRNLSVGELVTLYQTTKLVAESDSIGEEYEYCQDYTNKMFESEMKALEKPDEYAFEYLCVAIEIMALYK